MTVVSGLVFESAPRAPRHAPGRADVAVFVGYVDRRAAHAPAAVRRWLVEQGLRDRDSEAIEPGDGPDPLLDVPVPIERWDGFEQLFARGSASYLGAAVRSFFAQGGRKCYVVRVGDAYPPGAPRDQRLPLCAALLPGQGGVSSVAPTERSTWRGAGHLLGLPDASYLCLPDLGALVAGDPAPDEPAAAVPAVPEVYVECPEAAPAGNDADEPQPGVAASPLAAPRCDGAGYDAWSELLGRVRGFLSRHAREVQCVAAIPLPGRDVTASLAGKDLAAAEDPYAFLLASRALDRFASAFVQLVYPWVRTRASSGLPGGLESPDGPLTGLLARNALTRGSFANAAGSGLADVHAVEPVLGARALASRPSGGRAMMERVSVFGPTPSGLRLRSDVTSSAQEAYRQAHVPRLMSAVVRAGRLAGLDALFEPASERTWRALAQRIESVFTRLWQLGALRGASPQAAFAVRCDRTTMTQADLDAGRLIVEAAFDPAAAVERVVVVLTLVEGGELALATGGAA